VNHPRRARPATPSRQPPPRLISETSSEPIIAAAVVNCNQRCGRSTTHPTGSQNGSYTQLVLRWYVRARAREREPPVESPRPRPGPAHLSLPAGEGGPSRVRTCARARETTTAERGAGYQAPRRSRPSRGRPGTPSRPTATPGSGVCGHRKMATNRLTGGPPSRVRTCARERTGTRASRPPFRVPRVRTVVRGRGSPEVLRKTRFIARAETSARARQPEPRTLRPICDGFFRNVHEPVVGRCHG
jgi:hypothetical protein